MPLLDVLLVVVFLAGIGVALSNYLGFWSMKGQVEARAEKQYWDNQRKKWEEDDRKLREEKAETDRRINELLRRF